MVFLNLGAITGLTFGIISFPAPQVWSPFAFFGIVWCIGIIIMLAVVTGTVVWALAEPKGEALRREMDARASMRTLLMRESFVSRLSTQTKYQACFQWLTSFQGQTLMSTVNHLAAIGLFLYGLIKFEAEIDDVLQIWLLVGVALSGFGLLISGVSVSARKWPQYKCTPTDDSFRLACMFKISLVMVKSTVVFLLANADDKSESFMQWEIVVAVVSFISLAILAIVTIAFAVRKVWSNPQLRKHTSD